MSNNLEICNYLLPKKNSNKKTLVLDLDETLVHSQFEPFEKPSDITLKIDFDNEIHDIYVLVRPGVKQFLQKMGKIFEIVIFTASLAKYADPLLDIIDEDNICAFRLFREQCTQVNDVFIKEIQKLGRDLKDIIIVDNSPMSYCLNPKNGLPILSWFDDPDDRELFHISTILEFLSLVPDVRIYIHKFVIDDQICYNNVNDILRKYNEILFKNINLISDNSKNKILSKKNNSKKKCNINFIDENKENISNNIIQAKNKKNNNNLCNNIIKNRDGSKKNDKIKRIIYNIPYNKNKRIIDNKENMTINITDINTLNNKSSLEILKMNHSAKNKNQPTIDFKICPYISNNPTQTKSFVNLVSNPKKNNHSLAYMNKNNKNSKDSILINHKKSGSVNINKCIKKLYENKALYSNRNNNLIISNNSILRHKSKILNNKRNKESLRTSQNSSHISKNKKHKYGIQLTLKMNSDLIYELEQNDILNKKISKSLTKEKFSGIKYYRNNFCNKSSNSIKYSIPNESINRKQHKKSKSINLSYIPLTLKLKKEDNNNSFLIKKFNHNRYLSTSESYNSNFRKENIFNNQLNNSSTNTLSIIQRNNNSQRKINYLQNNKILKFNTNSNYIKKKENKIPFDFNKRRIINKENSFKNTIPIKKNALIHNNIKNNRYNKLDNNIFEYPETMTLRQKSSKKIIYGKIKKFHNHSFKEEIRNLNNANKKSMIGNIINDIICVNNIMKKKEIFVTESFKLKN